jgi:hypothetical protein
MLYIPHCGLATVEHNIATTSAELGTSVAAHATTAHTKNATYTTLIAATAYDAYGISVTVANTAVASTRTSVLVDIAIGGAGSEQVIIPNLIAGNQAASATTSYGGSQYYFPIMIPKGVRVSATCQAFTAADTVHVAVHLFQHPIHGVWYGQRVTAYGADTATSSGTSMSPGSSTYATDVSVSASTTNPIQFLQVGTDLLTNSAGTTLRGLIRVSTGTTPDVLVDDLPYFESTTLESTYFTPANMLLSQMRFDIPAGTNLKISAMRNGTAASRGWALYGVD